MPQLPADLVEAIQRLMDRVSLPPSPGQPVQWINTPQNPYTYMACAEAEAAILRYGLMYGYVDRLLDRSADERYDLSVGDVARIITATPRQRCEAMVAVLEAQAAPRDAVDRSQWKAEI